MFRPNRHKAKPASRFLSRSSDRLHGLPREWMTPTTVFGSLLGFAREIAIQSERLGLPFAKIVPIATEDWPTRAERPRNSVLDCSKFQRDFGLSLPPWQESLTEVLTRLSQN